MAINKSNNSNEIKLHIVEYCGVLSKNEETGYSLELRYISWNDRPPKYDLRTWKTDENGNEICGKGITMTGEELEALGDLINKMRE